MLLEEGEGDFRSDCEGLEGEHEQQHHQQGEDDVLKVPQIIRPWTSRLRSRLLATYKNKEFGSVKKVQTSIKFG